MAMREIEKTETMQQQLIFHAVQNGDFYGFYYSLLYYTYYPLPPLLLST